ncbi:hypothetical protein QWY84_16790 [Aquisalimonas lutea]|uniref:hypothetical protein n=1 Tax=Aquisalimonas lutea TaxID=1327750 RepID=UPI0025B51F0C|nr:hypothetical protein [Aquisalimonas lutea]MDN3519274.1 hypothetical protein [Aquisalimonas lutea]
MHQIAYATLGLLEREVGDLPSNTVPPGKNPWGFEDKAPEAFGGVSQAMRLRRRIKHLEEQLEEEREKNAGLSEQAVLEFADHMHTTTQADDNQRLINQMARLMDSLQLEIHEQLEAYRDYRFLRVELALARSDNKHD